MDKAEISELFKKIKRLYPVFQIPQDLKSVQEMVNDWHDFLSATPFETAKENLRRHTMDPDNKYPPHPGVLAEKAVQRAESNYVPNAEETRRMLEEQDRLLSQVNPGPIPDFVQERMRQLGYKSSVSRRPG